MIIFQEKEICSCPCHKEGFSIMHCMPCCDFTYNTYINEDGTFNEERYLEIKEMSNK